MNPVIGISTNFLTVDKGKFLGMERIYVNKDYVDAVNKAGGVPLLLPPVEDAETVCRYVRLCDGFILSGGGDINPALYGETPHPKLEEFHSALDRSQWLLTQEILRTDKPLLAVCRGVQLLNVVQGGTLWQDVSAIDHPVMLHSQFSPRGDLFHPVDIAQGSILHRIFGDKLEVNSFHHQCLKDPGKGLKITATAPDGIIEAVEMPDHRFVIGIQWHPEMLLTASDTMLPLFRQLMLACQ
ncbi:MAG: gamma-glutamyl-gamma-aminobutyrate hydrolase family protein [Odoribacter sp.]|nr:gamma-glutamyl-gamma-aminobutyrate hydrolase family protein [Odoribacter sp.]